ncbi:RimK family alpha-L-glutamate ligase [Mannheimia sp. AT1]|uniref:RimK family alpha-L-glutamate ligase n=1 Tax=Mannheimia cairinae TaxID=3025936 RepID=A0ABT5MRW3_9PAST|nr:RimK family alpha-L-glutamate ligase [Mannheimia cairinae]MDD0824929.1 RimK family alpha-L-glutamate ligase [Mannheimia cairinae]MDD0826141.1 RimK family alpha-L-glutamate ligase [Mannheimia cairinae]
MRWLMLCREPRLYSCQKFKEACTRKGIELDILDPNRMLLALDNGRFELFYQYGEEYDKNCPHLQKLSEYDAVLPRFGTASTEMGCYVLRHFEAKGTPVLNRADAFELARNKWKSLQRLMAYQLPVPNTSLSGSLVSVSEQINQYDFPIIAKVLNGSQGKGVMLFENQINAESVLSTFHQLSESYLCQQFIRESKGQDIRAIVIGNNIVAAMQRISASNEFRANLHQGGTAQPIQLTEQEQKIAIKAAQAIGLDMAGIDLLRTQDESLILEVNASPGFEGIEQVNSVDIATEVINYLLAKILAIPKFS